MADSYGSYTLDITAYVLNNSRKIFLNDINYFIFLCRPSMIAVQKITSLAFSVHDGMSDKKSLTREQQRYAIT